MKQFKFPNSIANEYRLVGKSCITLSNNCTVVGVDNVIGGYSFKITEYDADTRKLKLAPDPRLYKFPGTVPGGGC